MKTILEVTHQEARKFFLEGKNYENFDLPEYFHFDNLLKSISSKLGERDINYYFYKEGSSKNRDPRNYHKINHKILGNKDGEFAWRPYELMHPALYVAIVHKITSQENWEIIVSRFKEFRSQQINVASIPTVKSKKKSHKAEQIRAWWEKYEQYSVELGLDYQYVYDADVSDCYSSIYTHSISWALYGHEKAYEQRGERNLLGNKLDEYIQMMRHRRTNGIPQGSALSDFIAELIFGYADTELLESLSDINTHDYKIVRYRDDYRIFVNDTRIGTRIMKELTVTLSHLGLKLNSAKTKTSNDPIIASIKNDKLDELFVPNIKKEKDNFAKWLMQIYVTTLRHPNSGKTSRQLNIFHDELLQYKNSGKSLRHYEKPEVMLSVIINIALKNPKYYNLCMAVVSILIDYLPEVRRGLIIDKIKRKFDNIPNTGILDIWLQRISHKVDSAISYDEPATTLLPPYGKTSNNLLLWESTWLKDEMKDIISSTSVIDEEKLSAMNIVIDRSEVDIFQDIPS